MAAYTGDGSYMLIYGYDPYNISCLWNPGTENANTDKMGLTMGLTGLIPMEAMIL